MMIFQYSLYKSHYKSSFILGVPIIIGQIGNIVLSFADTLMIGHHDTQELAAASFVNSIFNLFILSSVGFTYGLTPLVGGLEGCGNHRGVGKIVKNSLGANSAVAIVLVAFMFLLFLSLDYLGQPTELLPIMKPYFLILLFSLPFVLWFNTFKQFADGITDTRIPMWILLSGNLLNIIGNYLLIYGVYGFPELGLNGAGFSTLFARIYMVAAAGFFFMRGRRYKVYWEGFRMGHLNKKDFLELNRLGWPVFFQIGMETASFSLSSIMVGWIGTIALAAHQIMLTVSQVCYLVYYGMSAAVAVRVAHFKGQHDVANVKRAANAGFHLILLLAIVTSLPVFVLRNQIGLWFTESPDVVQLVALTVIPFMAYQFGDGLQCTFSNALRGIGDVKPMVLYAFISYFVVSLPVGYLFGIVLGYGLVGVWCAFPFGLTIAGILYCLRFRKSVSLLH